jgi:glucosamine 6-phosphate synthetase-like amidotransferase/phosphosugar isomerase protein
MCGIFGFIGSNGGKPNIETLKRIATVTETRGRHAFGLAWINDRGRIRAYKQTGKITDALDSLKITGGAVAVIGHCRHATVGDADDMINNHPHPCDGGWLVHNGTILNLASVVNRYRLALSSECDSEALCQLIEIRKGSLIQRVHESVQLTTGRCAIAALWKSPARLAIARRGKLLHYTTTARGIYFGSLPGGLPGKPRPFPDGMTHLITLRKDGPHKINTEF